MYSLDKPLGERLQEYHLKYNPFPPATAGIETRENLQIPGSWETKLTSLLNLLSQGRGPKAFPLIGRYGSGKTYLLRWLEQNFLHKDILPYVFDNPGLQFYDLANTLMRQVGRYEFSKALWELSKRYLYTKQPRLIELTFGEWLQSISSKPEREKAILSLQEVFYRNLKLADDEEITYKLSLILAGTVTKPYFDYRDFIAGGKESLVAEKEEAPYFRALIRVLMQINNVSGIAFLIDEFEEVSLGRRISKRKGHEYLATLRRLISLSESENFWIVTAMTEEGAKTTEELQPALWERFTAHGDYRFDLTPLETKEAEGLLTWWLDRARLKGVERGTLFPFPNNAVSMLEQRRVLYPRPLVRFGFFLLSEAMNNNEKAPIRGEFIQQVIDKLFPTTEEAPGGSGN